MFKVNNKTPERLSTVFFLAFGIFYTFFIVSAVDFEQSTIKCSITNYCNNLQNCKKISEIETHERLSSTRETIETNVGHYCKNLLSFIFKNTSFKNLGARLGILRRRTKLIL